MWLCLKSILLAVILCTALGLCQANVCIESAYESDTSDLVYKCREGCVGTVPNCLPVCDNGCPANSNCTSPNVCVCNTGYIINELNSDVVPGLKSCKSACEPDCPAHSHCAGYNKCVCNEGYVENATNPDVVPSLQSCKPTCVTDCPSHSYCASPNICQCNKGYTPDQINNNIVPTLKGCKEQSEEKITGLQIALYILVVCILVFPIMAGISMLVIWIKSRKRNFPMRTKEDLWRTSFRSYSECETK
ncbi:uncharacterized protein Dvir_GJ26044 [Drosophila virilis]|uniref:EGF-like domain-containing protein n=1 Tax=Drosophila virilis TaxID=7244 RepID=A0A0Q9W7E5_DROVI|nr:von Willebrand factor D and EGF domain-containing protein [Drosophila virilis]KRF77825.1 uncharacterized protein Dvir_GJ26044 [Drosophila virilis]